MRVTAAVTLIALSVGVPWPAQAGSLSDRLREAGTELAIKAEQAIVAGGIVLYRHRHTVAGAVLGCAAGSVVGATTATAAGLATGGAALPAAGPAAVVGCGLGAAGGAAMGYPLDHMFEKP